MYIVYQVYPKNQYVFLGFTNYWSVFQINAQSAAIFNENHTFNYP